MLIIITLPRNAPANIVDPLNLANTAAEMAGSRAEPGTPTLTVDDINPALLYKDTKLWESSIFLIMGNAGFISSILVSPSPNKSLASKPQHGLGSKGFRV